MSMNKTGQNWACISSFRTELMGVATLLVLLYHGNFFGSQIGRAIAAEGQVGVEMFLFLSGVGLYFSMRKNENVFVFYRHRFMRIIPSYLIIAIPLYAIIFFLLGPRKISIFLYHIFQVGFLLPNELRHCTLWYVPFIVILYILYPVWYFLTKAFRNGKTLVFALLIVAALLCELASVVFLPGLYVRDGTGGLALQVCRLPIFLIGCYAAFAVQERKRLRAFPLAFFSALAFAAIRLLATLCVDKRSPLYISLIWKSRVFLALAIICACVLLFGLSHSPDGKKPVVLRVLAFVGKYSLEIYLLQELLKDLYRYGPLAAIPPFFSYYFIVVPLSIVLAVAVRSLSGKILPRPSV